jgi:hypothetical protein
MSDLVRAPSSGAASAAAGTRVDLLGGLRYGHDVVSMCPQCLRTIPGRASSTAAGVAMRKTCPDHGAFECLRRDRRPELRANASLAAAS